MDRIDGAIAVVLLVGVGVASGFVFAAAGGAEARAPTTVDSDCLPSPGLSASKERTIGVLGLQIPEEHVAWEHVAYAERTMQWGHQAWRGELSLELSWDAVADDREVLGLTVTDQHGTETKVTGASPLRLVVPVPDVLWSDEMWVIDLVVDPVPVGADDTAAEQPFRLDIRTPDIIC